MTFISGVIITFNEESNIERCLRSLLPVVDEIVVLDSFSSDRTKEICLQYNVRFFEHVFDTYGAQKNRALLHAAHDYVLSLDADEELDVELQRSILKIKEELSHRTYSMGLRNNHFGYWSIESFKHTNIRLFNRHCGHWFPDLVHESWNSFAFDKPRRLKGAILHYGSPSEEIHRNKILKYSRLSAQMLSKKPKLVLLSKLIINPICKFLKSFLFNFGFLDGRLGFKIASGLFVGTQMKYYLAFRQSKSFFYSSDLTSASNSCFEPQLLLGDHERQ